MAGDSGRHWEEVRLGSGAAAA